MKSWKFRVKIISRSKQLMKKQLLKIVKPMIHEWCVIQLGNKHGPQMKDTKSQLVKNTLDTLDNKNSSSDTISTSDSSVVASNI